MKKIYLIPILALLTTPAYAVSEIQLERVKQLGELNGIALNCGYIDETRRMKRSLVSTVPKIRVIGLAFDESTNSSFLSIIKSGATCPTEKSLSQRVDSGIEQLEKEFLNHQEKLF